MTFRQMRRLRLKEYGFLPFEAKELRKVPLKTPYLRLGMRDRRRTYREAIREYRERGLRFSRAEWARIVREMYVSKDWLREGRPDTWQMLRSWEEEHKAKFPEYESPPKPRRAKVKRKAEFHSKFATGLAEYERGRYR